MQLTRTERWILANQYRILARLEPDSADYYEHVCRALERGYEGEYDILARSISADPMSVAECREVVDILAMFDSILYAYNRLSDKTGIDEQSVRSLGFDGNNESVQLGYWHYLYDGGRFRDLDEPRNSHSPSLGRYRRMLEAYGQGNQGVNVQRSDIERVIAASRMNR